MTFVCYPKCTTCQKARKWLLENNVEFNERNIKDENPNLEELKDWHGRATTSQEIFQHQWNEV